MEAQCIAVLAGHLINKNNIDIAALDCFIKPIFNDLLIEQWQKVEFTLQ